MARYEGGREGGKEGVAMDVDGNRRMAWIVAEAE
jgi:hypothetical protein